MTEKDVTPAVKSAVNAYLLSRAYAETMRVEVNNVYREILEECPLYADMTQSNQEPKQILNVDRLYLCTDELPWEAVKEVYEEGNHRLRKLGLKPDDMPDEHCPALVAECLQRDTEHILIDAAAEMLGENGDLRHDLICAGMDKYHQFIDLVVGLVVNLSDFKLPLKEG